MPDKRLDKLDAPEQLNQSSHFCSELLKKLRRLKNRGFATDEDLEDARIARDAIWRILNRANWRGWWKEQGEKR